LKRRIEALADAGYTEIAIQIVPGQEHAIEGLGPAPPRLCLRVSSQVIRWANDEKFAARRKFTAVGRVRREAQPLTPPIVRPADMRPRNM
jgi:hypothetical protein